MNRYQIDVVNTYACNVAVDKNEDHEPSIEKCTHKKKIIGQNGNKQYMKD